MVKKMSLVKKCYLGSALALLLVISGCGNEAEKDTAAEAPVSVGSANHKDAGNPHNPPIAPPKEASALTGQVVETFDSAGYTYLQIDNGTEKIWAAIGLTKLETGQQVSLINGPVMQNFHSKSLNRTFPEIIFSAGLAGTQEVDHGAKPMGDSGEDKFMAALTTGGGQKAPMNISASQASGGSTKAVVAFQNEKIEKAEGATGYTVGEIYSQAHDLNGKTVKIRGKVVKVSPNIMGVNWLHLQDGSGDAMKNQHDLVVTSDALAELGSVVIVEGVLAADKDFGSGYEYDAIVEQAKVVK